MLLIVRRLRPNVSPLHTLRPRSLMINGMAEPSLLSFLPNETPHLIDLRFFHLMDLNVDRAWIHVLDGQIVDVLELIPFFLTLP
jgi:hypothetical protein